MEEKYTKFGVGVIDSCIDERDYIYANVCGANKKLPSKFLNGHFYVKNQKNSMKCVGFATSSLMEIKEAMRKGDDNVPMLSAQFVYYNAKTVDDLGSRVEGTTGRAACDALKKYGICEDKFAPFIEDGDLLNKMIKPCREAYQNAEGRKIDGYARLLDIEDIKNAIVNEGGCMVSMLYYSDMLSPIDGYIGKPAWNAKKVGNHMKLIVGYDDEHEAVVKGIRYKGFFIQLNSYGDKQGVLGVEYIPYDFMNWVGGQYNYSTDKIFREAWVVYDNTNMKNVDYFKQNQPTDVIKKGKSINMILQVNSNRAIIDDKKYIMDVPPRIKNGNCTFVPLRFIAEAMECEVTYFRNSCGENIRLVDKNTGRMIDMTIGAIYGYINGKPYKMFASPYLEKDRTLVPVRAFAEMFQCKVDWDEKTKTIMITR